MDTHVKLVRLLVVNRIGFGLAREQFGLGGRRPCQGAAHNYENTEEALPDDG